MASRRLPEFPNDYNFHHAPDVICGENDVEATYQVPLPAAQAGRAMALYRESLVVLAHTHCVEPGDFEEMRAAGVHAAVSKVDVDGINLIGGVRADSDPDDDWFARGDREMRRMVEMAEQPGAALFIARQAGDLLRAASDNKVAIILSFEGARPLAGKLENVAHFHQLGMREMQLWWAVPNQLKTPDQGAFSEFGLAVIREMNRLGILIDLSHITGRALEQALEATRQPITISHCSVGELYGDPSKPLGPGGLSGTDLLNDAAIRAIAVNGGVICLHFVTPDYIRARHGDGKATIEDWGDHLDSIANLVGIDYVALGPDFFPERGWKLIRGGERMGLLPNVAREMVRRGYSDDDIRKVLGLTLLRLYRQVWET